MEQVSVGLVGLGTVGAGAARILTEHADLIARRAGRRVRLKWAVVRDLRKPRGLDIYAACGQLKRNAPVQIQPAPHAHP